MGDSELREAMVEWLTDSGYEPGSFGVNGHHKLAQKLYHLADDALDEMEDTESANE